MKNEPFYITAQKKIGKGLPTYFIAEIGSNHEGDLERAKTLVRKAAQAGACAVKFQSFQAEKLLNRYALQDGQWMPDPAFELLRKLELPKEWHRKLQKEAEKEGIDFVSTPFDLERLELLLELDVPFIKIASGDLTYTELLEAAGKSGKPVFLSTGHAENEEVEEALSTLARTGASHVLLLHAVSAYPTSFKEVNLYSIQSMQKRFKLPLGWSDHTPGGAAAIGAVTLGACVIEKHITDDRQRQGPDHAFAMLPEEFFTMTQQIRQLEKALGSGRKRPQPSERQERILARRAVYAKIDISCGDKITRDSVNIVRHAYPEGIAANQWTLLEGKKAKSSIRAGTLISWDDISLA